jgi:hypothetical protein
MKTAKIPFISGYNAALKLATSGALGKKYNEGLVGEFNRKLESTNSSGQSDGSIGENEYDVDPESMSAQPNAIALLSSLTPEEKSWYTERAQLLAQKKVLGAWESSLLVQGFDFDIPDDLEFLSFMTKGNFPGASSKLDIPNELVKAGLQQAFVSAALMELLIYIHSQNCMMSAGFGLHRATNFSQAGTNNAPISSGTVEKRTYVTDHAFGRAIDIVKFKILSTSEDKNEPKLISVSAEEYMRQLDALLSILDSAPTHLLPDFIKVGNWVTDDYVLDPKNAKINKILEKYPNLKYVAISKDAPNVGVHQSHIHISFSSNRAGRYVGPGGLLIPIGNGSSGSTNPGSGTGSNTGSRAGLFQSIFKSFLNDDTALKDTDVFELLNSYGNFSEEISAIFTAIAFRESVYKPFVANSSGYFGLWQIGSRLKDGSDKSFNLVYPTNEKTTLWKISYKNWKDEEIDELVKKSKGKDPKENLFDNFMREKQTDALNNGKQFYDERIWVPVNQVMALRGKISRTNMKEQISIWGDRDGNSLGAPWGDTFMTHGFIAGLSFYKAAEVYKKATGKDVSQLQNWVLENINRDSRTRKVDQNRSEPNKPKTKLEAWVDLTYYTKEVLAEEFQSIYPIIYGS